jgi:hypothetical protein
LVAFLSQPGVEFGIGLLGGGAALAAPAPAKVAATVATTARATPRTFLRIRDLQTSGSVVGGRR